MWPNRNRSPAVAPYRKTGSSGNVDALPAVVIRLMTKKQADKGKRLTNRYTLFGVALALFCALQIAIVLDMETKHHAMHHATKVFALSHALAWKRQAGAYAKTVLISSPNVSTSSNVERALTEVKQELKWFRKTTRLTDHVVALVYSAMLGKARHSYLPPKPLTIPFMEVFQQFKPKDSLLAEADKLLAELFKGEKYLAVHLRLRDHCKTSIDDCCCETSGNLNRLTCTDIENFIDAQRDRIDIRNVFISGPPSLERMAKDWPWAIENADTVKLWYSKTAPGSLEESVLQQIICSKAAAFFYSNPSSTWSLQSKHWQDGGSVYEQLGKVDEL